MSGNELSKHITDNNTAEYIKKHLGAKVVESCLVRQEYGEDIVMERCLISNESGDKYRFVIVHDNYKTVVIS